MLQHALRELIELAEFAAPEAGQIRISGDDPVLLRINTDFTAKGLSSTEIKAVVSAWQAGAISQATMFDLFRKGEVLPTGRTDNEEEQLVRDGLAGANRTGHLKIGQEKFGGGPVAPPTTPAGATKAGGV